MALFYNAYSTWKGKYLFLDDLVVSEKYRRNGVGEQLIQAFLKEAKKQEVHFVKWQVLHWNSPAIEFYKKLGVEFDEEWIDCKKLI
jgi:ribosomal protein S18 acetylase RimI-like enzyme